MLVNWTLLNCGDFCGLGLLNPRYCTKCDVTFACTKYDAIFECTVRDVTFESQRLTLFYLSAP